MFSVVRPLFLFFFFRFLLLTLLYQFSHRLSTLYFDFLSVFHFLFCLLLRNYFYFQIIIIKYPCRTVSKRIRQDISRFSYFLISRDFPVISFGCSMPISSIRSVRCLPGSRPLLTCRMDLH